MTLPNAVGCVLLSERMHKVLFVFDGMANEQP
jgi:hypothetical protein